MNHRAVARVKPVLLFMGVIFGFAGLAMLFGGDSPWRLEGAIAVAGAVMIFVGVFRARNRRALNSPKRRDSGRRRRG
jgi:hypothetical protein